MGQIVPRVLLERVGSPCVGGKGLPRPPKSENPHTHLSLSKTRSHGVSSPPGPDVQCQSLGFLDSEVGRKEDILWKVVDQVLA